jgi:DedD protein
MTETPDPQLPLKKRARRRLVGAVAFAGLAAVVLLMVMDEEPKQQVRDVQIRIPGQEQPPFKPRELASRSSPDSVPAAGTGGDSPSTVSPPSRPASAPLASSASGGERAPDAASTPATPADDKVSNTAEKVPGKTDDKSTAKVAVKPPVKAAEKPVVKPAPKTPEKPAVKKAEKSADKKIEGGTRSGADDAQRASALLAGKTVEELPPVKKSNGSRVIRIGAFANPENAKQLQSRLAAAGVNAYAEVIDTPEGKKTRVRAGPFQTREAAEKALGKMKGIGVNGVVAGRQ